MQRNLWVAAAAVNGFIAVGAGAFGAHGLKGRLSPEMLAIFETAARYQMYHALGLLLTAVLLDLRPRTGLRAATWCFLLGIVLFSGSLYALALSGVKGFGAITPLGGVAFLCGWLLVARSAWLRSPAE